MVSASRYWLLTGIVLAVSAAGCALGPKKTVSDVDWRTSDPVSLNAPESHEADTIQQTSATIVESPIKAISSGLKTGAEKVSDAFTPSVRPADDPTSLSTKVTPGPQLYLAMARLAEKAGRMDEAEQRYRQALDTGPEDMAVLVGYARMKHRQGEMDAAIELYERAAKAHPDQAIVFNDLGLCFARRKQFPQALAALEKAVELDEKQPLYRNNIATLLIEMGKIDAAYANLAAVHPPAVAYYNVGYLLQKRGDLKAAKSLFAQALRADPSLRPARAWLDRLEAQTAPPGSTVAAPHGVPSRLEDPSVEAPDLRAMRRRVTLPVNHIPPTSGGEQDRPRPVPIPTPESTPTPRTSKEASLPPKRLSSEVRQLPPILGSRPLPEIVPQSWEDAPLPSESNATPKKTEHKVERIPKAIEPASPLPLKSVPASEKEEAGASEASDAPVPQPEPVPPAPLPNNISFEAAPMP